MPSQAKTQQIAARIAGFFLMATVVTAYVAEDYALGGVFRLNNPAATARNIVASEQLFRLGIIGELATVAGVIVVIVALYVLLNPVKKGLALLALSWRLVECILLATAAACPLMVLRLLSGSGYLTPVGVRPLEVAAYLALEAHAAFYNLGIFFYSLGSTVFCYLLFRSRYLPRGLALLGLVGSLLVLIGTTAHFAVPHYAAMFMGYYWIPVAVFEVVAGLWLLIAGARIPAD
jgi:hypothetical protein